jgi:hypothetical protein
VQRSTSGGPSYLLRWLSRVAPFALTASPAELLVRRYTFGEAGLLDCGARLARNGPLGIFIASVSSLSSGIGRNDWQECESEADDQEKRSFHSFLPPQLDSIVIIQKYDSIFSTDWTEIEFF